jgi:hypothetical protein
MVRLSLSFPWGYAWAENINWFLIKSIIVYVHDST